MTSFTLIFSILISTFSFAWGYADAGYPAVATWVVLFGLAWLVAQWRRLRWFSSLVLVLAVLLAALGVWFRFNSAWMVLGAIFALFAWDMTDFRHRLHWMAETDETRAMERRHIGRVSLLALTGHLLVTFALLFRMRFTFEWGIVLVIVILFGLAQLVGWFRRQVI